MKKHQVDLSVCEVPHSLVLTDVCIKLSLEDTVTMLLVIGCVVQLAASHPAINMNMTLERCV